MTIFFISSIVRKIYLKIGNHTFKGCFQYLWSSYFVHNILPDCISLRNLIANAVVYYYFQWSWCLGEKQGSWFFHPLQGCRKRWSNGLSVSKGLFTGVILSIDAFPQRSEPFISYALQKLIKILITLPTWPWGKPSFVVFTFEERLNRNLKRFRDFVQDLWRRFNEIRYTSIQINICIMYSNNLPRAQ